MLIVSRGSRGRKMGAFLVAGCGLGRVVGLFCSLTRRKVRVRNMAHPSHAHVGQTSMLKREELLFVSN